MNHTIIAFGNRKGVGKTTAAGIAKRHFEETHHQTVILLSFAIPVKQLAHQWFGHLGLEPPDTYDRHLELKDRPFIHCCQSLPYGIDLNITPRQLWCRLGEALRAIYPDVFLDVVKREIDNWVSGDLVFIIHDLRLKAEFDAVKAWGGLCVKVVRADALASDDPTECELDGFQDWDLMVHNDGSRDELDYKVRGLMDEVFTKTATD